MCGIVGVIGRNGTRVELEDVIAMRDVMRHRGPDDEGVWRSEDGRVALGHRRLAIIDLSPAGRGPMGNEDGSVQVNQATTTTTNWRRVYEEYNQSLGSIWLSGGMGGVPGA